MSQKDLVKEQINYLKVWLGIAVVTLISLIGWSSSHIDAIYSIRMFLSFLSIMMLLLAIHFLNKKILEKIDSLKEL